MSVTESGVLPLALASLSLLALAWLIGVQGMLSLISNYRRNPEDFPDGAGLGRWMGWTLAAGGASFGLCGLFVAGGVIPVWVVGPWAGATGAALAGFALGGIARYRRRDAPPGQAGPGPNVRRR